MIFMHAPTSPGRRRFLAAAASGLVFALGKPLAAGEPDAKKALVAITLDLEMSAQYPRRDMLEWNYQKGNLDEPTKKYARDACRLVKERGGVIHCFCVGQVLEQADIGWLQEIAKEGHPVGNHTYDHVNVKAAKPEEAQFRFQRAPWLIRGRTAEQLILENIRMTSAALQERANITANGFRTPGGFANGLEDRKDIQQMLLSLGYSWVSSRYPAHPAGKPKEEPGEDVYAGIVKAQEQAQPFVYASGLIEVPMSPISDVYAFRTHYWKLDYFLKAIRLAVTWAIDTGSVFDFLAHPSCLVVEDPGFASIKLICDLVQQAGDKAALVGLDTIAARAPKR
jgi:peptidoglycan/xylan/chitin deacetylase (PgdA/CDA1 family)